MQIHELDTYIGTLSDTDYFVVDDGTETFKIPATNFTSVINAYPRAGQTPLTSGWLSETDGGTALTPAEDKIYILMADSGTYTANTMFRWNSTAYEPLTSGGGSGTSVPTADTVAEFDSTAHMNSTDMTAQEVSDFVDNLDISGGEILHRTLRHTASGNKTYGAQITELKAVYDTLSDDEKRNAILVDSANEVFQLVSFLGVFTYMVTNASTVYVYTYNLYLGKMFKATNNSPSDVTSSTNTASVSLYA